MALPSIGAAQELSADPAPVSLSILFSQKPGAAVLSRIQRARESKLLKPEQERVLAITEAQRAHLQEKRGIWREEIVQATELPIEGVREITQGLWTTPDNAYDTLVARAETMLDRPLSHEDKEALQAIEQKRRIMISSAESVFVNELADALVLPPNQIRVFLAGQKPRP